MMRRTLSLLLCLVMVLGMLPVIDAQATVGDDVVYIDETTGMDELVDSGVVQLSPSAERELNMADTVPTLAPQIPVPGSPVQGSAVPDTGVDALMGPVPGASCSCSGTGPLDSHSDGCVLKQYYIGICTGTPQQIHQAWLQAGEGEQAFLLARLENEAPEKLAQVQALIDDTFLDDAEDVDRLSGEASATVDGVTVEALGVPEGSSLTVQEPTAEVVATIQEAVTPGEEPDQLFLYDISVQNGESSDWQPEDTSVRMSLSIPGLQLHKYATVRVLHVDDEGNTSELEGTLDSKGNIVFETEGFSTFAGFTVDFEYGTALVSIPGETSILMSELFEQMKMPLYASDVVDVQFTNYDLLTVTQQEGDWLLTSLVAFDTQEKLTFTMADGTVYEFIVTDAQYASIKTGANGTVYNDENGTATWYANSSGNLTKGVENKWSSAYWATDKIVYITGPGEFLINIQPDYNLSTSATVCYVRMKQVRVCGGADVTFRAGGQFHNPTDSDYGTKKWSKMENIRVLANEGSDLFYIEDGSLKLDGSADVQLQLSGDGKYTSDLQLVFMAPGADNFVAEYTTFYNAPYCAIMCRASAMNNFTMTNCDFRNTVYRSTYGGAIYMPQSAQTAAAGEEGQYTRINNFSLSNVDFAQNYAAHGGAIALRGRIYNVTINSSCTFDGCYATGDNGGAILIDGAMGNVQIAAEFKNCYAAENGGAIAVRSAIYSDVPRWSDEATPRLVHMVSRTNTLDISGSRFTNCGTKITGSTTEGRGGAVDISCQVARVYMNNCTFDGCYSLNDSSSASGAAVCFSYYNLPENFYATNQGGDYHWSGDMIMSGQTTESGGARRSSTYDWVSTDENGVTTTKKRTTIGDVTITGTTFKNCTSAFHGGALLFRSGSCAKSLTMTDVTIDNCSGGVQGGAMMFVNTIVSTATMTRVTISNCKTLNPDESGGILRTVGNTSMVLTLDSCVFRDNSSALSGGGLYWNAGLIRVDPDGRTVTPKAYVKNCKFIGNSTYLPDGSIQGNGGGIFCEAEMEVTNCTFVGNKAGYGGAISMAVYGNDYRMMEDGEVTYLKLDSQTEIYGNTANYGGGIMLQANRTPGLRNDETLAHGVKFELGGATVHDNVANINGGGVCFRALTYDDPLDTAEVERYEKTILIDNGSIYNNTAGRNGGGVYMQSNNNTTISVTNGTVYDNQAGVTRVHTVTENTDGTFAVTVNSDTVTGGDGGGIYLTGKEAVVTVTGGLIGATSSQVTNDEGVTETVLNAAPNIARALVTTTETTDETTGETVTTTTRSGGNGGGIGIFGTSRIEMSGGTIAYNQADVAGGGIAVHDRSSMSLTSGTVDNNRANYGGGISINNSTGVAEATEEAKRWGMYFNGGTISNNKAFYMDDVENEVYLPAYGGGVCLSAGSTMRINSGTITGNIAARDVNGQYYTLHKEGGGVAVCDGSEMVFYGGTVSENQANCGGGLAIRGGSTVTMNPVTTGEGESAVTTYGLVDDNTADYYGGGIYLAAAADTDHPNTITINDGTVSNNTATKYSGGGVYVGSGNTFTIANGKINNNQAMDDKPLEAWGGGVYCTGSTAYFQGGEIYENSARCGGGVCLEGGAYAEISNGKIHDNTVAPAFDTNVPRGAGVYANGSTLKISNGEIYENTASQGDFADVMTCGGGVNSTSSTVTVEGGTIRDNWANRGGGFAAESDSNVTLYGGTISGNTATERGGGLAAMSGAQVLVTKRTVEGQEVIATVTENEAWYGGGVAALGNGTKLTLDGGLLEKNHARNVSDYTLEEGYGGGIYASAAATVDVLGGSVQYNTSNQLGGGLCATANETGGATINVTGGTIQHNETKHDGGGIYAAGTILTDGTQLSSQVNIQGGTIQYNKSLGTASMDGRGGGLYATQTAAITVTGGDILNNSASHDGGGIMTNVSATATINGGNIKDNTAKRGGGIFATANSVVTVQQGTVTSNDAGDSGGGICVTGRSGAGAKVVVKGGEISENTAVSHGGGIYVSGDTKDSVVQVTGGDIRDNTAAYGAGISASVYSDVTVSNGTITSNDATTAGGGIYAYGEKDKVAKVTVSGGDVTDNTVSCGNGGGIYASTVSRIFITNGTVSGNTATYVSSSEKTTGLGGGIYFSGTSQVTVSGGSIVDNRARRGGGIYATGDTGAQVTVSGGSISENTASNHGGGIYATGSAAATVKGGAISDNVANGNGGGIFASGAAPVVTVSKDGTNNTVGTITKNTAYNGGGVYVGNGASLTVDEGYITYNTAIIPQGKTGPATCKGASDTLYGTGGGVCVASGTGKSTASFTLTGDDMAIYGNLAAHSADDVFANGSSTQLDIPLVADMNLAGYGFSPEGWFEDYNTNDTQYEAGLNMSKNDLVKSVERYRFAVSSKRKHITPVYVRGQIPGVGDVTDQVYVNKANAYVAMTLGIPAAVDDTVVVDFGLSVEFDLKENDLIVSSDDFTASGKLGMKEPVAGTDAGIKEKDDVLYGVLLEGIFKTKELTKSVTQLKHGKATMTGSNVKYEFLSEADKLNMTSDETFYYVVGHGQNTDGSYKNYYYAQVTIVPATSIYYEDNSTFIKFHDESDGANLVGWQSVGSDASVTDKTQDQDRPGAAELKDLDADNIYGYDSNYSSTATYSMGSAMWTQVSGDQGARASFTFTGTGFDIISLCNKNTGTVVMSIYEGEDVIFADDPGTPEVETPTTAYKTLFVDSWYETGDTLYQIPLIKESGLPYGTWTVELYVAYGWWADHGQNNETGKFDFYLDAVRIYDPAGVGGSTSGTVQNAYLKDQECWPSYQELRNLILTQDVLTGTAKEGILFIDGASGINKAPTITQYQNFGPNNEVYIAADQAVSFTLNAEAYNNGLASSGFDGSKVAAVHLAMRGLTGAGSVQVRGADGTCLDLSLSTTDLYYDISELMGQVVTVENTGTSPISVSNVKITHTADPGPKPKTLSLFSSDLHTAQMALSMLGAREAEAPELTLKYPTLSFESEIRYDVFFDVQNLGTLTGAELGLAVFTAQDPEGTVATADDVILGAQQKDGLYVISTNGIPAKNMGDRLYFKAFAKLADGSYVYSELRSYNAVDYATNILATSEDQALKTLVVAMLNYGAKAQSFFGYNTDAMMNAQLTAEDQALVAGLSAAELKGLSPVDMAKVGAFGATGGFVGKYPAVSFGGAFEINYNMIPGNSVDADVTLYCWTEDTYNGVPALTAGNADLAVTMSDCNGTWETAFRGIVAKDLDKTVYAAAVYESDGQLYSTGILTYSIASYCQEQASDMAMSPFVNATAIYGCAAKAFFGE